MKIIRINFPVLVMSKKIFSLKIMLRDFSVESKKVSSLKNTFERSLKDFILSSRGRISSGELVRSLAAKLLSGCGILFALLVRHMHHTI